MSRFFKPFTFVTLAAALIFTLVGLTTDSVSAWTEGMGVCVDVIYDTNDNGQVGVKDYKICAEKVDGNGHISGRVVATAVKTSNVTSVAKYMLPQIKITQGGGDLINYELTAPKGASEAYLGNYLTYVSSQRIFRNDINTNTRTLADIVQMIHDDLSSRWADVSGTYTVCTADPASGGGVYDPCNDPSAWSTLSVSAKLRALDADQMNAAANPTSAEDTQAAINQIVENNNQNTDDAAASGGGNQCYEASGSLGWIVCPVTNILFDTLNGVYQWIEEDFLKIDANGIFNTNTDEGAYPAWSAFRNIANILFIILFIFVILSQLTGFGIDNYGIKKILPRLIVIAILINLSYIICQLAVDVSNILGVALRDFTSGLAPGSGTAASEAADSVGWIFAGFFGGTAVVITSTLLAGPGMIIAILAAAISGVIAALFLLVILMVREAGVILAVALAPVAIACYLLPNTESLGKRWLSIFRALLVLYPLCSLVIGAGVLAGNILGNVPNNEGMHLAAMIVQVVPFFFIPMLLRQSLNGLGNIGARLSNFGRAQGRNLGGRFRNAAGNTNIAQNSRFNATQRRTGLRLRAAGHANSSNGNRLTRGLARVVGGSQRTQARYIGQRKAMEEEELKNSRALADEQMRSLIAQAPAGQKLDETYGNALQAAVDSGDKNRILGMMSAIEQSNMSGSDKNKAIRQAFDRAGLQIGGNANTHADVLRSVAQQHQGLMAADPELMRWANAGGLDKSGGRADLNGYAAANMSAGDVDDKDLDGITKSNLENLINQGIITQNQAKRHWANGGGKSDAERLMFGSAGDGHVLTTEEVEKILKLKGPDTYTATNGRKYGVNDRDKYLKRNPQEVTIV